MNIMRTVTLDTNYVNEEEVLVRLTPYWIVYSIVTLVFGVLVLIIGMTTFDGHEDDLLI
jgi:hypothetical protein